MRITPLNNFNLNTPSNKMSAEKNRSVSFEGIIRPSKLIKTKGGIAQKFHVLWVDIKRNYNVYDFENSGKIKNKSLFKLPIIRNVADFFELKLKNTYKVSEKYYRGGFIACEYDILRLKRKGVTDIVNLTESQKFNPHLADFAKKQKMNYHRIELLPPYGIPTIQKIKQFFEIIKQSKGAVYVHCLHGKDRTGIMTFMHEVDYLKRTTNQATKNMIKAGINIKKNPKMAEFLAKRYPKAADKLMSLIK